MLIVFERERSVLKSALVFEREQLYRPSGAPFWPFWQKASSGGRKGCLSSNDSAYTRKPHSSSSGRGSAAPLRTHSAKIGKMVKIKRAELLSFGDEYCFQKTVLWFEDKQPFRHSEDAFCQSPDFVVFIDLARWSVRSGTQYSDFVCALAKKGLRWRIYADCRMCLHIRIA